MYWLQLLQHVYRTMLSLPSILGGYTSVCFVTRQSGYIVEIASNKIVEVVGLDAHIPGASDGMER